MAMMNKDNFIKELKKSLIDGNRRVKSSDYLKNDNWICYIDCDGEYDDGLQYYHDIDITCDKFDNVMKKYNCSYDYLTCTEAVIIDDTIYDVEKLNKLERLPIDKCEIYHIPKFDTTTFVEDFADIEWSQKTLKIMGKDVLEPRKTFIGGTEGSVYKFAGLKTDGDGNLPNSIIETMEYVEEYLKKNGIMKQKDKFNFCVCNYYENGNNYIGMHSDKGTPEGDIVASLSYGVSRHFDIKTHAGDKTRLELNHGDLLIMTGATQQNSKHGVPKQLKIKEARINLTFRMNK